LHFDLPLFFPHFSFAEGFFSFVQIELSPFPFIPEFSPSVAFSFSPTLFVLNSYRRFPYGTLFFNSVGSFFFWLMNPLPPYRGLRDCVLEVEVFPEGYFSFSRGYVVSSLSAFARKTDRNFFWMSFFVGRFYRLRTVEVPGIPRKIRPSFFTRNPPPAIRFPPSLSLAFRSPKIFPFFLSTLSSPLRQVLRPLISLRIWPFFFFAGDFPFPFL